MVQLYLGNIDLDYMGTVFSASFYFRWKKHLLAFFSSVLIDPGFDDAILSLPFL